MATNDTLTATFEAWAHDFEGHPLVAEGRQPAEIAYASAMLHLYRSVRVLQLMDQSGHHEWPGMDMTRDDVLAFKDHTAQILGLTPGDETSDQAVYNFIAFRLDTLKHMPYDEYLQTPEWKDVRRFAIHRAGGRCQNCNHAQRLHVHHRTYDRRGCESLADVTVLCADCHQLFHEHREVCR